MRKKLLLVLVAIAAAIATLVAAPVAIADDTPCVGTLSGGPYENVVVPAGATCVLIGAEVRGNVTCDGCRSVGSNGSTIRGNVQIKKATGGDGEPNLFSDTIVGGTVEEVESNNELDFQDRSRAAELKFEKNTGKLSVETSTITGNIQAQEINTAQESAFELEDVTVGGDVLVQKSRGTGTPGDPGDAVFLIELSEIAGNLQMQENTGASFKISDNEIGEDLQFFKNRGASVIADNRIGENLQCKENKPPPVGGGNTAEQKEGQCRAL